MVLGLLRGLRLALPAAVHHPHRPELAGASGRGLTEQARQVRPVVLLRPVGPDLLLAELEVAVQGLRVHADLLAARGDQHGHAVHGVGPSVARYSVIRFQSRATSEAA
ncbi:hypothetical protein ABT072_44260 [Streptomyces sp. NPDC002589]|uniref:hypothetical protein n=1 Tax=Streptomyces sp. NPDC002589 TaxID=3154420 RepID=UPI003322B40C